MLSVFKSPVFFIGKQPKWFASKKFFCNHIGETNLFSDYEKIKHLNIIRTENFLKFNPKLLSNYKYQEKRFHLDAEGNLILFNNKIRRDTISEIINSNDDFTFITGQRGVGKSHLMALLVFYLRNLNKQSDNLIGNKEFRVFYISNPKIYFLDPIQSFKDDLIYFAGDEIQKNEKILKKFLKIRSLNDAMSVLQMILNYLEERNINNCLCLDQCILNRRKIESLEIFCFISSFKYLFSKKIINGSNTNETIFNYKIFGKEIIISNSRIFANDEEIKSFIQELNFFEKKEISEEFFNYVSEITNFVPLEISKLSKSYLDAAKEFGESELKKQEIEEEIMKKAKKDYFEFRIYEMAVSHANFRNEYFIADWQLSSFIYFLFMMDKKEVKITNLKWFENIIDYNCMEADFINESISSVCPASKKFLEKKYNIQYINELNFNVQKDLMKKLMLDVMLNKNADSYEILVKTWLKKKINKFLKFSNQDKNIMIASNFNYIWTEDLSKDFRNICQNVGDYIFSLNEKHFDIIDLVYYKNSGKGLNKLYLIKCSIQKDLLAKIEKAKKYLPIILQARSKEEIETLLRGPEFTQNSKRDPNYTKKQQIWNMIQNLKGENERLEIKFLLITNQETSAILPNFEENNLYESLVYYIDEEKLFNEINIYQS